tara:strand:+ start:936 stop:1682 length:747 start_codon:yes stop_codon:yes gene_type:complete
MNYNKNQTFTCSGINSAIAILESKNLSVENIFLLKNSNAEKNQILKRILLKHSVKYFDKNTFNKKFSSRKNQGIIVKFSGSLIQNEIPKFSDKGNICLLALDRIEDPQNFGQIIRTVECAGFDGIIYSKHSSVSLTGTVLQVSQGAFVNMKFYEVNNIRNQFKKLKNNNFWIVGLENSAQAKPWYTIKYNGNTVIVLGSEGKGIRQKVMESCDFIATIPMQGITNSLNVSAAASAIAFERLRQQMDQE